MQLLARCLRGPWVALGKKLKKLGAEFVTVSGNLDNPTNPLELLFWSLSDRGNIVGELYTFLKLEDEDFADGQTTAYLCAFRVNKEYRGKGYGSMLMNTAVSDLKSKNLSFATIGVGMDEESNQKMYEHMGFNRKIKECFFDPCARDKDMKPAADEGFILLSKEL